MYLLLIKISSKFQTGITREQFYQHLMSKKENIINMILSSNKNLEAENSILIDKIIWNYLSNKIIIFHYKILKINILKLSICIWLSFLDER